MKFESFKDLGKIKKEFPKGEETKEKNGDSNDKEKRHPLEKVDWNFLLDNPRELLNVFSKKLDGGDKSHYDSVYVAPRDEYPMLDGWTVAFSKDYVEFEKNNPNPEAALVVRNFNENYGKGANLIVFPPEGDGNANKRTVIITEDLGIQAKLVSGEPIKDKGDSTEQIRIA